MAAAGAPAWTMDRWRYYDITHEGLDILNPLGSRKLDVLLDLAASGRPRPTVVDMGCGKGEALIRLAERHGARGVGVDISPPFVRKARRRARARVPGRGLRFVLGDGAAYRPPGAVSLFGFAARPARTLPCSASGPTPSRHTKGTSGLRGRRV